MSGVESGLPAGLAGACPSLAWRSVSVIGVSAATVLVEFEPFIKTPKAMRLATRQAMWRFAGVSSVTELWQLAATEFRAITGFDRVMVEHFHADGHGHGHGHGEIVAESIAPDLKQALCRLLPAFPKSMVTGGDQTVPHDRRRRLPRGGSVCRPQARRPHLDQP